MSNLTDLFTKTLRDKQLHRSTGAIAGLASAFSVTVGPLAAYPTPKGWGRVTTALHMTKKPFARDLERGHRPRFIVEVARLLRTSSP